MPEEVKRARKRAARLRARVLRDVSRALTEWLARVDRERKAEPA